MRGLIAFVLVGGLAFGSSAAAQDEPDDWADPEPDDDQGSADGSWSEVEADDVEADDDRWIDVDGDESTAALRIEGTPGVVAAA